ncbi:response regulator [Blautia sp. HCP3S3_G3]|uniref:response regulator n=1 Tax=Blautia sp. HCP3S3_G3 TaxID=3438913 RepID=UPI003F8A12DC
MYRILLVDDEILVRDAIRENIDWAGMDCELVGDCQNGQEAAEFVNKHPVDIVLTDICMPYMDGMELSHFLHDNYPDIVIVIFSGFGEFEYAKKAIQYNVSEYLLKPITAMELTAVIGRMKEKVDQRQKEKRKLENLTKASENYRKNAQIIRSKAIEALVGCSQDVNESLAQLKNMGIELVGPNYRVAVFDIDLYSDMYKVDVEKRQESALMAFVLYNISNEIAERESAGIAYQEGSNRVCILFQGVRTRDSNNKIRSICREIQQKVKEVIGIEVSMGIGGWVRNLEDLILSHDVAAKAIQYRYLLGGSLLLDMEEKKPNREISLYDTLEQLTDSLKTGKKETMELCLSRMEQEIKDALVEKSRACMYLQQIVRAVGSASESLQTEREEPLRGSETLLRNVTEQSTFQQAIGLVKEYAEEVFEKLSSLNSSSGQRQASLALDYIQNNYMDPNLSLNSICSYLSISTSYFSTIFKEVTGETFMEVLIRTRMDKARELLENTTLKNYEIAEKVGFSDPHYFGISFKKITGKTPTEYAREYRK